MGGSNKQNKQKISLQPFNLMKNEETAVPRRKKILQKEEIPPERKQTRAQQIKYQWSHKMKVKVNQSSLRRSRILLNFKRISQKEAKIFIKENQQMEELQIAMEKRR